MSRFVLYVNNVCVIDLVFIIRADDLNLLLHFSPPSEATMFHFMRVVLIFLFAVGFVSCGSDFGLDESSVSEESLDVIPLVSPVDGETVANKAFSLAWAASDRGGESRWRVTVYAPEAGVKKTILTLVTEALDFRALELRDNRDYTWKVEALNSNDDTVAVSEEWGFHTYATRMLPFAGALDQGSYPDDIIALGGGVYFSAYAPSSGRELWWKPEGGLSVMVKDIRPGDRGSGPTHLTACGEWLYFAADDGVHGRELWGLNTNDSSSLGMVKDIFTPTESGEENKGCNPNALVGVDGALYFSAQGGADADASLWMVAHGSHVPVCVEGVDGKGLLSPEKGVAFMDGLLVSAIGEGAGRELWRVQGETATLHDLNPGAPSSDPRDFSVWGESVYFRAHDAVHGAELWSMDKEGVCGVRVDIEPGGASSSPGELTPMGGALYFAATTGAHGRELWRSDGTTLGTFQLKDIWPQARGSQPRELTPSGDTLFFGATTEAHGFELWRSDGTEAGTTLVHDLWPGAHGGGVQGLTAFDGGVIFSAEAEGAGREPWFSGGEGGDTLCLDEIRKGAGGSDPFGFAVSGHVALFKANDGIAGAELWESMGTAGTARLADNINPFLDPDIEGAWDVGNRVILVATSGEYGRELFTIDDDGKVAILFDMNKGYAGSNPGSFFVQGDLLYFSGTDGVSGQEPWVFDGGRGAVVPLGDLNPGAVGSSPLLFAAFDGKVVFLAEIAGQHQLWETDGTRLGTRPKVDDEGNPISVGGDVFALAAGPSRLFFRRDGALWACSPAGALEVIDGATNPEALFPLGASLLFSGVGPGEERVSLQVLLAGKGAADPVAGESGGPFFEPLDFFVTGERLFFSARQGEGGGRLLCEFFPGNSGAERVLDTEGLPVVNPTDFCGAGGELWVASDGIWGVGKGERHATLRVPPVPGLASLVAVGEALYYVSDHLGKNVPILNRYEGGRAGVVLDFSGRPLLGSEVIFSLHDYLFLTALDPLCSEEKPVRNLWVTSP